MKIQFFIRQLNSGGAQSQLIDTAIYFKNQGHEVSILTIYGSGKYFKSALKNDIKVSILNKKNTNNFTVYFNLIKSIRSNRSQFVICYSATTSILSIFAKPFTRKVKIIWYLRNSTFDATGGLFKNRIIFLTQKIFSRYPDLILTNSILGKNFYQNSKKFMGKIEVLPNAINSEFFKFKLERRIKFRYSFKLNNDQILVAIIGRIHFHKNHKLFIQIANRLLKTNKKFKFIIVGKVIDIKLLDLLKKETIKLNIEKSFIWIDEVDDLRDIYSSIDILMLTSTTEGFPNVVAEAVSSGVYTIANNVGDCKSILSELDFLVNNNSINDFVKACQNFKTNTPFAIQKRNQWINQNFSQKEIFQKFLHKISNLK